MTARTAKMLWRVLTPQQRKNVVGPVKRDRLGEKLPGMVRRAMAEQDGPAFIHLSPAGWYGAYHML